jgi:probable addiction module antidote protein
MTDDLKIDDLKVWDSSEHLDSEEMIFAYVNAAMEEGDPALLTAALGDVARARGMTEIARKAGMSRESLYRALSSDGNPELATVMKVMKALGLRMSVTSADAERHPA